jgi:hypothetical protein
MNIRFEPVLENFGFDPTATPDWMMIPLGEDMPIWLVDGAGLAVTSTSPGIATVTVDNKAAAHRPTWRILRIKGKAEGRTFIEVRREKQLVKRLEVAVKPPITLKISFHFVSDNAKPINHATNRKPEELDEMIFWLNQIFTPQTNIRFEKKNHFPLKFNKDMGDAVNYNMDYQTGRPLAGHEWETVIAKRDATAHMNIFFVWRNEFISKTDRGKIEKSGALGYSVGGRDCLIEDWDGFMDRDEDGAADNSPAWENARMLAHEVGHILGIGDVNKTLPAAESCFASMKKSPRQRGASASRR